MLQFDLSSATSSFTKFDLLSSIGSNFDSIMETPPPLIMGAILAFWGVGFNGRPVESELSLGDILRILASPYFMDIDEERSGDEWSKLGVECPTVMQEKVLNIVNPQNAKYFLKDRKFGV